MSGRSARAGDAAVTADRERLLALCARLVACDSAQPKGDTRAVIDILEGVLAEAGIVAERVANDVTKPNLVAIVDGGGPGPHIGLNGHADTLDAGDPKAWSAPPYSATRRDGRMYGLGIGNMKAGVAVLTFAFLILAAERRNWGGRLSLTIVADEVVFGPAGAAFLLRTRPDLVGDMLINAEGAGNLGLAVAEKGLLWLKLEATAAPLQGMLARRGSTAAARLARLVSRLDDWNDERIAPPAGLTELAGDEGPRLTVNVGRIMGGSFISQVATSVVAEVDFRIPPGTTAAAVEDRVRGEAARIGGVAVTRIKGWDPSFTAASHPLVAAMRQASAEVRGVAAELVCRLPASDAQRWRAFGVPSVCYGPQPLLASGIDDYVIEDDVVDCLDVTVAALRRLLRPNGGGP